jgi:hypothetical protein
MPFQNMPVQRLKVTILPMDLLCSGLVTHSGEILTTGKFQNKKPSGLFKEENSDLRPKGRRNKERPLKETSGCVSP